MASSSELELQRFLPYRLSVLANRMSKAIGALYERRFDLKLPEWRVMAVLGRSPYLTASEIADVTAMDKVAISRAVARMMTMKRVAATLDAADRRKQRLFLTKSGQAIYKKIAPLALSVEQELLKELTPADRHAIDAAIIALMRATEHL